MIDIADPDVGHAESEAVQRVLESGHLAAGDEVREFERRFADRHETEQAVATANGTAALHAVLEALDLPEGARVVTTPLTFVATANAIRLAGYEPVFVDVDPETYTIDPGAVETALASRDDVAAILAVHLYGLPADMLALRDLADEYDVALVEDAAQAHDAAVDGKPVGTMGDAATFSFYPTKNMTTGEGGMVLTDDAGLADRVASFINHGRTAEGAQYDHASVGHNFRLTDLAAAIGNAQLDKLDEYTAARRENAATYDRVLADTDLERPVEPAGRRHVYHQYTVRTDRRDELRDHLDCEDVGSAVYYPTPVHQLPPYSDDAPSLPVAERLTDEVLSLPVHPTVTEADIERVGKIVRTVEEVRA